MRNIKHYGVIILGILLIALSYNLFFSPYQFDTGGISGLSIALNKIFIFDESLFILTANMILLIISYIVLGKEMTKNTILGSLLLPVFIKITENINNWIIIENLDKLIIAILGGVLSGIGYGLLFKNNFTSGGTDILNQIALKKFKIPLNKSMMYIDGVIVLFGGFVLGIESMIYSIIALQIISTLSNKTMFGINKNKVFYIETSKYHEVLNYLTKELEYDVTIFDAQGGYTNKSKKLILCSIKTIDYYKVKTGLEIIDPNIFVVITENYELLNENLMVPKKEMPLI